MNTILCPVDFSEGSDRALAQAIEFARALQADIHLLHVFQMPTYPAPMGAAYGADAATLLDHTRQIRNRLQERLSDLKDGTAAEGVEITTHLAEGRHYSVIVESAKKLGADLIVMGTHGRSGLSHLVLGSVAERVVRLAESPVLTVPMPNEKAA